MLHMTEICAGCLCVCVGVHMFIVYRQWSFSGQLFIWGFHDDMLHNKTDGDYRLCICLEIWCFVLLQRVKSMSGMCTLTGTFQESRRGLVEYRVLLRETYLTCYQLCYPLLDHSNNA